MKRGSQTSGTPPAQHVGVHRLRRAQVQLVDGTVRIEDLRVAHEDPRSARSRELEPAPAGEVLSKVEDIDFRLRAGYPQGCRVSTTRIGGIISAESTPPGPLVTTTGVQVEASKPGRSHPDCSRRAS